MVIKDGTKFSLRGMSPIDVGMIKGGHTSSRLFSIIWRYCCVENLAPQNPQRGTYHNIAHPRRAVHSVVC